MAKTKYKEYFEKMLEHNKDMFDAFRKIHDKYVLDQEGLQEEYNKIGAEIMNIINDYEDRLCRQSEKGGYGSFTVKLSEKFRAEIKKEFSHIDYVGIQIFNIKKISL